MTEPASVTEPTETLEAAMDAATAPDEAMDATAATTVAEAPHAGSSVASLFSDPTFAVAAAFLLFMLLAYKKMATFTCNALDNRSARIKTELDEARRLREEAAEVLAQYKRKQAEYLKE